MENLQKSLSASALLLLAVASLCPAPAAAQPFVEGWAGTFHEDLGDDGPLLPVAQVRRILRREGVRLVGLPHVRGGEIIAIGRDDFGARKKVVLDARTGEVLDVTLIDPPRQGPDGVWRGEPREGQGEIPGGRARGGEFDGAGRPLPPPMHSRGEGQPLDNGAAPGAPRGPAMQSGVNPDVNTNVNPGANPELRQRNGDGQPSRPLRQPNDPAARPAPPVAARPPAAPAPTAPAPAPVQAAPAVQAGAPAAAAPAPVQAQAAPAGASAGPARSTAPDRSMSPIKPLRPDGAAGRSPDGAPKVAPLPN